MADVDELLFGDEEPQWPPADVEETEVDGQASSPWA